MSSSGSCLWGSLWWVSKSRRVPIAPHVVQFTPDMLVKDDPFFERRSERPIQHYERAHGGLVGCRDVKTLKFGECFVRARVSQSRTRVGSWQEMCFGGWSLAHGTLAVEEDSEVSISAHVANACWLASASLTFGM